MLSLITGPLCRQSADIIQSTDRTQYGNLTNLSLKGIIGIKAMSDISVALDMNDDAHYYSVVYSSCTSFYICNTQFDHFTEFVCVICDTVAVSCRVVGRSTYIDEFWGRRRFMVLGLQLVC